MNRQLHRCFASTSTMFLWALFLVAMTASYLNFQSFVDTSSKYLAAFGGGLHWERQIRASAAPRRPPGSAAGVGMSVLVTGAAGFVGTHCSLALRKRGDGVDNFNAYYDPSLKKARKASHGVFVVEGDINDGRLLAKLFDVVPFTHVLHLAAQAGARYALENPASYVHSNIAGLVTLLEACKDADPQPAIVWASSSSVYGLNDMVPFSERDRTDHRPRSTPRPRRQARRSPTRTTTATASPSLASASSPCTAGHGLLLLHPQHPTGEAHHGVPRQEPRRPRASAPRPGGQSRETTAGVGGGEGEDDYDDGRRWGRARRRRPVPA